jgi:hypothetical protein
MTTLRHTSNTKLRLALLALLTVTTLLMPPGVKAAERDGTMLFFSLEDIQQVLAHPSLSAFASLLSPSQPMSSFTWRAQSEVAGQDSPRERNTRYGNGLWADGYRLPGPRPLWGY